MHMFNNAVLTPDPVRFRFRRRHPPVRRAEGTVGVSKSQDVQYVNTLHSKSNYEVTHLVE